MEQVLDEQIKKAREVPIALVLGLSQGRSHKVKCPFHGERTPSCMVYKTGGFHCFGCGANGQNAIDFLTKMGFSFREAVTELNNL